VTYDLRGNLTSDGKFNYTYNVQDRMIGAESIDRSIEQATKLTFAYDAQGRRISRTEETGWNGTAYTNSETTKYAYDGVTLIAQLDTVGNVKQTYQWGIGKAGTIGALLSITDLSDPNNPQTYTPVYDHNGNIVGLLDENGDVAASYSYLAFGEQTATGPAANVSSFGFQTMYRDSETGLLSFPKRDYSTVLGWTTRDRIYEQGGLNLSVYCHNDPINGNDPTGLEDSWWQKLNRWWTGESLAEKYLREHSGELYQQALASNSTIAISDTQIPQFSSAVFWTSYVFSKSADVRLNFYNPQVQQFDPFGNRADLKLAARNMTPEPIRSYLNYKYPNLGPPPGSIGRANISNEAVTQNAIKFGRLGTGLAAVGTGLEVYNVATAPQGQKLQTLAGAGGRTLGGIGGGIAGAEGGAIAGAWFGPWGAATGAVIGGISGSFGFGWFGGKVTEQLYLKVTPQEGRW
jgi:RHS repeat-associated protein